MKKFLIAVLTILILGSVAPAMAQNVDANVSWTQSDYDQVNYWILYWGATAGGPYDVGQQRIDKTMLQPDQSETVTIQYPANAKTTYYFVIVAFKDASLFSGNSNEFPFTVDFVKPGEPVDLRITIIPAS